MTFWMPSSSRGGRGLTVQQVTERVTEAARRERETQQQVNSSAAAGRTARPRRNWRAVGGQAHRVEAGRRLDGRLRLGGVRRGRDVQWRDWARERDARRDGVRIRRAAWERERQEAEDASGRTVSTRF